MNNPIVAGVNYLQRETTFISGMQQISAEFSGKSIRNAS
jgi:hypothetical protein